MPPTGDWFIFPLDCAFIRSKSSLPWLTPGQLALFWSFSSRRLCLFNFTGYWPLVTVLMPLTTYPARLAATSQTFPRWLLPDTDRRIVKTERDPISTNGSVYFSMSPNQAISSDKSIRFSSLAAARPLTSSLSRPEEKRKMSVSSFNPERKSN